MPQALDRDDPGPTRRAQSELHAWIDRRVLDIMGQTIGVIVDIYRDGPDHRPAWLAVSTGLLDTPIAVPADGAAEVGRDVVVAHDRHAVFTVPGDAALLTMDPSAARAIASHYARHALARPPADRPAR